MSDTTICPWVILHYQLPAKPSASRVYIWRKLKRLGAILWGEAMWVLPDTVRTREHFQWLAAEIVEMSGSAWVWTAEPLQPGQHEALARQFSEQADAAFRAILAEVKKGKRDLPALAQKFQQTTQTDYFGSAVGQQVRAALTSARGGG